MDVRGRRITLMGLGRHGGGVAAARHLAQHGARLTVSDLAPADLLAESLEQLRDVPIGRFALGGHDEADFRDADAVVVNPAVPLDHPLFALARDRGAQITSEIELFLEACPAPVIGVTGTNGKSTTAAMIAAIMKRDLTFPGRGARTPDRRRSWLGGNIGRSLLPHLKEIRPDDAVVLELSSFQLAHLSATARLPEIAVITNCSPNHLDWHGDNDRYVAAKQRIVRGQKASAAVVINNEDAEVSGWCSLAAGRLCPVFPLESLPRLALPGCHNRANAACAAAAARAAGGSNESILRALREFQGLEHRLELVGEMSGRLIYNDSKSTTPESTRAALATLERPIWLLAGGHDKGASFGGLGTSIVERACGAAFFGHAREGLRAAVGAQDASFPAIATEHLADALGWCWSRSRPGDAILLSPACASYDQFRDFQHRGQRFVSLARQLCAA